jgi:hypothetical protein
MEHLDRSFASFRSLTAEGRDRSTQLFQLAGEGYSRIWCSEREAAYPR